MSDIKNRGLYVLQIEKPLTQSSDTSIGSANSNELNLEVDKKENQNPPSAFIKSVSEFPLSSPILSFGIIDAAVRRYKCNYNDNYLLDEMDEYDEECNSLYCVVIRMYLVGPKSLQECRVLYQPSVPLSADVQSTLSGSDKDSSNEVVAENVLDNFNDANSKPESEKALKIVSLSSPKSTKSESNNHVATPINLMTPNSFSSPGKLIWSNQNAYNFLTINLFKGKVTPEGVSLEVLSAIRMLAKVQSPPDAKNKADSLNILNLVNSKTLEEHELKVRKSVELNKQTAG